ncbi:hypothetical protein GWI33_005121 [Rhynchophorus ferrugineus]|uniref:AAA+ ATPase domain-containing protein n=1 Tax=Rhynchophorus ferrugineus TaxID=354439 RepID=A0A834MJR2_RHYFE|nr:hypothetical protein GWI33_005121 [Rhynchophorus ferrugineus]
MVDYIDIEVILNTESSASTDSIKIVIQQFLENKKILPNTVISEFNKDTDTFYPFIRCIIVGNISNSNHVTVPVDFKNVVINWYIYSLDQYGVMAAAETDGEGEEVTLATYLTLPSQELFTLWENLYYEDNIKNNLLKYARTIMEFSNKGINPAIVSCNKVILLHGPPGTGKTSLCKALAQKLSIKLNNSYSSGILIEINSHSLFSKWFSESGKLVNKMFTKIREACENTSVLVCVLIDEVESLAHARDQCLTGNEPSDSIRVVNAMLTQIDQIKKYPNVLILATSNMTEAIDLAFVDRADIKQFLGFPSVPAIYKIYTSCLNELMRGHIIKYTDDLVTVDLIARGDSEIQNECSKKLLTICQNSVGLSGRTLRKIPFLAHALYVNSDAVDLNLFLNAMLLAVEAEHKNKISFTTKRKVNSI